MGLRAIYDLGFRGLELRTEHCIAISGHGVGLGVIWFRVS